MYTSCFFSLMFFTTLFFQQIERSAWDDDRSAPAMTAWTMDALSTSTITMPMSRSGSVDNSMVG